MKSRKKTYYNKFFISGMIIFGMLLSFPKVIAADIEDSIGAMATASSISLIISIILFIAILLICYYTSQIKKLLQILLEWQIDHEKKEWNQYDKYWRANWPPEQPKITEKKEIMKPLEFFPKCGIKNEGGTKFCKKCGQILG